MLHTTLETKRGAVKITRRITEIEVPMPDGSTYTVKTLLTNQKGNPKLAKSEYVRGGRYSLKLLALAPHVMGGVGNACPWAHGCVEVCSGPNAGHGQMQTTTRARIAKTRAWRLAPEEFAEILDREISEHERLSIDRGQIPCVRPNGFSDYRWHKLATFIQDHPRTQFWDYTKDPERLSDVRAFGLENYHVTFSRDEKNHDIARGIVESGGHAAIVFRTPSDVRRAMRNGWEGLPVISGENHDLRFLDRKGPAWVALYAKGYAAQNDTSGFVVDFAI